VPAIDVPEPPLTDGAIRLRPWAAADAPAVTRACQDPDIARWTLVPSPYTEAHAHAYIAAAPGQLRRGSGLPLAIADAGDDALLGAIGLNVIDWERRSADLGYWIVPAARGRGAATSAVRLLTQWAFAELGLAVIELRPHRENAASQAVALRAGYAPVSATVTRRTSGGGPGMLAYARWAG
jgi:RimJ/RimL family protein N-acetyltransferase